MRQMGLMIAKVDTRNVKMRDVNLCFFQVAGFKMVASMASEEVWVLVCQVQDPNKSWVRSSEAWVGLLRQVHDA